MSKGWHNNTDILNAVNDCIIRRLSTQESLLFLKEKGFSMSESKFTRIKRYIRESTNERLDYIAYHEYSISHLDAIDTVKSVKNRLWEIVQEKKGTKYELKALELITQNVKILEEIYDSNPIVAGIAKKMAGVSNVS